MKTADMKLRCSVCKYYRLKSYADGHYSIGCMKASKDGIFPVDIVALDRCPRDHVTTNFKPVDESQLLKALGHIYAETATQDAYMPLYARLSSAGRSVSTRKTLVGKAIIELGILKVMATTVPGKSGRRVVYRWDTKKHGPPSLAMASMINKKMEELSCGATVERKKQIAAMNIPDTQRLQVDEGSTSCLQCWMRDLSDCRERLLSMGIDCKKVNVNSLRHEETSMG